MTTYRVKCSSCGQVALVDVSVSVDIKQSRRIATMSVERFAKNYLSVRGQQVLRWLNLWDHTVDELAAMTRDEILAGRGCGWSTLRHIKMALLEQGIDPGWKVS